MELRQDAAYDPVSRAYHEAFIDIAVRAREIAWIEAELRDLPSRLESGVYKTELIDTTGAVSGARSSRTLLELGCGTGALLRRLAKMPDVWQRFGKFIGIDPSEGQIQQARMAASQPDTATDAERVPVEFVCTPADWLPFASASVDVMVSMLSFRYFDWWPSIREIVRVLKPGGQLLVVDMCKPGSLIKTLLGIVPEWLYSIVHKRRHPDFYSKLRHLVSMPEWKSMLKTHPPRLWKEYSTLLDAFSRPSDRLPERGKKLEFPKVLSTARRSWTIAFTASNICAGHSFPELAILDWGVGGFGFFKIIKHEFPELAVTYMSDAGFLGYGRNSRSVLQRRLLQIIRFLAARGVRHLCVACNAMSTALGASDDPDLLAELPPGFTLSGIIRPAINALIADTSLSPGSSIAVIGGKRTIECGVYQTALSGKFRVLTAIAQDLSGLIEQGLQDTAEFEQTTEKILAPVQSAENLVLACTHYPAALPVFTKLMPNARVIDPADALVQADRSVVEAFLQKSQHESGDLIFTTGNAEATKRAAKLAFDVDGPSVCELTTGLALRRRS